MISIGPTNPVRPKRPRPNPQRPKGEGAMPSMPHLFCGLDLGQAHDLTALAVAERIVPKPSDDNAEWAAVALPEYHVRALERPELGTPYPVVAKSIKRLFRREPFRSGGKLIVDATGVGRPVVDQLRQVGLSPIAVTITGGSEVTGGPINYRVPKADLIAGLIVLFQQRRIRVAASLHLAETLMHELEVMRMRATASGRDQYGAYGEGEHDDLVLALALAVWYAERRDRRQRRSQQRRGITAAQLLTGALM